MPWVMWIALRVFRIPEIYNLSHITEFWGALRSWQRQFGTVFPYAVITDSNKFCTQMNQRFSQTDLFLFLDVLPIKKK